MAFNDKTASGIYFQVDQWISDNINQSSIKGYNGPKTKKDWNEGFKMKNRKLSNVDDGAVLAGDLLHQLLISKLAMTKYAKQLSDMQREISDLKEKSGNMTMDASSIKNMISHEIGTIVPELVKQIEDKLHLQYKADTPGNSSPTRDEETHALVIENKNSEPFSPRQWSDVIKGPVSQKLDDVQVAKSSLTADGKGYVAFPNRESRDIAAEALKNDFVIVEKDKKLRTLLPKMKICDIKYYKKEDTEKLKLDIPKKNPRIKALIEEGATLDVIFIREPSRADLFGYAVVRVDPKIREEIIKNRRKIFIDTMSYYVKDQIHVTQCFACQQYGHKKGSQHCSLYHTNKHTCLYCAKNHESKNCSMKNDASKYKCANCVKTLKYGHLANHASTSHKCPIFAKEANSIIRRTICDTKNFPIQRVVQRQ